jgi:hypothetical protein
VQLFLATAIGATLGAALGCVVERQHGRAARAAAIAVLLLVATDVARTRDRRALGTPPHVEDAGPLVHRIEAERGPGDVVLVYARTSYVWAYYQRPTPRLEPLRTSIAYAPRLDDPHVRLVDGRNAALVVPRAFTDAPIVWFVGSRYAEDGPRVEALLRAFGTVTDHEARDNAVLLRLTQRQPTSSTR